MSRKNQSVDKITENAYGFVGRTGDGSAIADGSVVLSTDSRKRGAP